MIGFYYKIITRKFKMRNTNTVFQIMFYLVFMLSTAGEMRPENLIVSTVIGIVLMALLYYNYNSFGQKKFDAIVQMLGSTKGQNILYQFLNTSSSAFLSLLIYLVLSDLTKLINTNFNFLDASNVLSLNNLPLTFLIILGINLTTSVIVFINKKETNLFKILRS